MYINSCVYEFLQTTPRIEEKDAELLENPFRRSACLDET